MAHQRHVVLHNFAEVGIEELGLRGWFVLGLLLALSAAVGVLVSVLVGRLGGG
jgi:hypothetical protein